MLGTVRADADQEARDRPVRDVALPIARLNSHELSGRKANFWGSGGPLVDQFRCHALQCNATVCNMPLSKREFLVLGLFSKTKMFIG